MLDLQEHILQDPSVLQQFSITGTLGINAFAVLGLEAEAGVGLTLLGHDVKAGVNVTAAAGLRAYAEATPTFQYTESAAPEGGKVGESRLKGHFEAAAQLFLQLSGALFYELDSPWWSPAPDGREETPLGEVQYPIGDSMGIGADIDWLVGSSDAPELKFSPVEFDPDKFTADVMAVPPPRRMGDADANPEGQWTGEPGGEQNANPEVTGDGEGLPPSSRREENLQNLPDEQKYMRALDEMSQLENADPKPTEGVVEAKARRVKSKYGLNQIQLRNKQDDNVSVFVRHAREDNGNHLLVVPLMSEAERIRLLSDAMADLRARETNAAGEDGTIEESAAQSMLQSWLRAHPAIESARVVDGGETWDYMIDVGDRNNTETGLSKGGEADGRFDKEENDVTFTSNDGEETHTVYVDEQNGTPRIIIESTPQELVTFLDNYLSRNSNNLKQSKIDKIEEAKQFANTNIKPKIDQIEALAPGTDDSSLMRELLMLNMQLSLILKDALVKDIDITDIVERYALEGTTGRYNAMPEVVGDKFTPDHQPQAAVLEYAAEEPFFNVQGVGNLRRRAADRAAKGFTINLFDKRHIAGRTYGSKGTATKAAFIAALNQNINTNDSDEIKRSKTVDLLKNELQSDIAAMNNVVNRPNTDNIWKDIHDEDLPDQQENDLINSIRQNVKRGEQQLANQPMDNLND